MKRALVTGASRGIGRAIAESLLRDGYEVTGTSRHPEAIRETERLSGVRYLPLDLASEQSINGLTHALGDLDLLVNNAGQSQIGAVEEVPMEKARALFQANFFGTMSLIQRVLPGMRGRRHGMIISIASFAAVTPVPFLTLYGASKAALLALHRGLRHEVSPWEIRVAVVAPLDVNTAIPLDVCYDEGSAYLPSVATVRAIRDKGLAAAPQPALIAEAVVRILHARHPRLLTVAGRGAASTGFLVKHLPAAIVERIVRRRYGLSAT